MEDWIIGLLLALFIIAIYLAAFLRYWNDKKLDENQAVVWQEIASQTDLKINSGYRKLEGEYHGYQLTLWNLPFDRDYPSQLRTTINLWLNHPSNSTLTIRKMSFREKISNVNNLSCGNEDFDRNFSIKGKPDDFVSNASILISQTDSRVLDWATNNYLSLELQGSDLNCRCYSMTFDAHLQIAFLDLLCALAASAEEDEG